MHAPVKEFKKRKSVGYASRLSSSVKRHSLCLLTVIIPTLLSVIYFGFIASDVYVSESTFVVRSPQRQSEMGGLGTLLQGTGLTGFSEASDDTYTVEGFIRSRDALMDLDQQLGLRSAWSNQQLDFLHRFGMFGLWNNFEYLYLYYLNRVDVKIDSHSNMIDLSVNAFSADQAYQINELLLQGAERLVNKLNDRARHDLIGYAQEQVNEAKKGVTDTSLVLADYRNKEGIVEPEAQSTLNFELISNLQTDLIATKTELAKLRAFAPDSPSPPTLEFEAKTLQAAIDAETAKVAGSANSLSSKDARYEELAVERQFAVQQLSMDLASLQTAQDDAQRQQLYLEIIAKPRRPDVAVEPMRIQGVLVTLLVSLIVWGIASMLIAGIREHQL
jgi:capsular polysaccharide transport system permease protein